MADQSHAAETVAETGHAEVAHHGYDHFYQDPSFWVGTAIIVFFLLIIWKKIPGMVGKMLDEKSEEIAAQLDNAQTLREEASSLLAKYQREQRDAEKTAAKLLAQAEAEVELLAGEAKVHIDEMISRRTKLAEQKIAQAEANALKEIQQVAVSVAGAAARELIADNMKKADRDALIKSDIEKLDSQLH
ncbi:ATP F0F1 synthase subunit B [Paremcibacter congregatus]|jgi:F-type H+-transporting ATPase subunit b|uniref:ATP synthase subunit b n=1 Tax=Paremcibacter congregatus TaxID=2043170 RepID=A0A2G4YTH3_9PROT|nr:ATP F0F1 synthase subunit B [Paremcibacter congregatus]PHZ85639.1 ATP F0F1 synthase subunit B [Paremcibacter congregatus]QDE26599.1 ATP F0F1 synthase subunit B [Paremcibacter congregatus]|tara:strand:- start:5191 stop:5754 length:564 start_codon:yes stop_codon:yes gene_type:complete